MAVPTRGGVFVALSSLPIHLHFSLTVFIFASKQR